MALLFTSIHGACALCQLLHHPYQSSDAFCMTSAEPQRQSIQPPKTETFVPCNSMNLRVLPTPQYPADTGCSKSLRESLSHPFVHTQRRPDRSLATAAPRVRLDRKLTQCQRWPSSIGRPNLLPLRNNHFRLGPSSTNKSVLESQALDLIAGHEISDKDTIQLAIFRSRVFLVLCQRRRVAPAGDFAETGGDAAGAVFSFVAVQ